MKIRMDLALAPLALLIIGALVLYGCGSGGSGGVPPVASIAVPVAGANSPFIGVMMKVTCANGNTGQESVGTDAAPGIGIINVTGACTPPIRIEAIGAGKMRPIGAPAGGSQDVVYDPAINLPVSNVLVAIPTTPAPVNPVTTLVANQVTLVNATTNLATVRTAVATALGLAGGAADFDKDYRNAGVAAASTAIVEVAALAAANAGTNGMPAAVTSSTTLGQVIAQGLANQAGIAGANFTNATNIATALKAVDAKLDVSTSASLPNIDSDATRVNNLIAVNVPASTNSAGLVNALVTTALTTAQATVAAGTATAPVIAQARQTIADVSARMQQVAQDSMRDAAAKMVANVAVIPGVSATAVNVAQAAATQIVTNNTTLMQQTGAVPANIAAQAQVTAAVILAAIQSDAAATTKIFAKPPAVGISGAAAALVGQVTNSPAVQALTASSTTTFNTANAATNALTVATAVNNIPAPGGAGGATQAAFQAAVGAVASMANPATINPTATATQSNLANTVTTLQIGLVTAIGTPTNMGVAAALAQQSAITQLGGTTSTLSFALPPAVGPAPSTLPTTQDFPGADYKLNVTVGSSERYTTAGVQGLGALVNGVPIYSGEAVQFGPYTVSGLSSPTTLSVGAGSTSSYVSLKANGGAASTKTVVSSGDTLSIYFDFAACITGSQCDTTFGALSYFSIQNGTTNMIFDVSMCSDPNVPPVTWSKPCK